MSERRDPEGKALTTEPDNSCKHCCKDVPCNCFMQRVRDEMLERLYGEPTLEQRMWLSVNRGISCRSEFLAGKITALIEGVCSYQHVLDFHRQQIKNAVDAAIAELTQKLQFSQNTARQLARAADGHKEAETFWRARAKKAEAEVERLRKQCLAHIPARMDMPEGPMCPCGAAAALQSGLCVDCARVSLDSYEEWK